MPNYRITTQTAKDLVQKFVDIIKPEENNIPLGGTIHKDTLYGRNKMLRLNYGNMSWYCWSEDPGKYAKLFLAFEETDSYDTGALVKHPDSPRLMRPTNIFWYAAKSQNVSDLIDSHYIHPSAYHDVPIDRDGADGVIALKDTFIQKSPRDSSGQLPYNKYPYSFFENRINGEVHEFTKQIEYVRYYFGYDDVTLHHKETNRIRVILVGVDSSGTNITGPNSIILQNSWPPPPEG